MRLGISGKGGVGKTTISAVLARTLARSGHQVIAIDCDSDPNLAINCGLTEDQFASLQPFLNRGIASVPVGKDPVELLHDYGMTGPDGVTHLLGARIQRAGAG